MEIYQTFKRGLMIAWIKSLFKKEKYSVAVRVCTQRWCPVLHRVEYTVTVGSKKLYTMTFCRGNSKDIWITTRELSKVIRDIGARYNTKPHVTFKKIYRGRPTAPPPRLEFPNHPVVPMQTVVFTGKPYNTGGYYEPSWDY